MNMYVFDIPWGGSLAIRREVIDRAGLLEHWSACFCEDVSAHGPITRLGLRIAFVPTATQFNSETIDVPGAYRFILRQFLCARLHHADWPKILACNLLNFVSILFFVFASIAALGAGHCRRHQRGARPRCLPRGNARGAARGGILAAASSQQPTGHPEPPGPRWPPSCQPWRFRWWR